MHGLLRCDRSTFAVAGSGGACTADVSLLQHTLKALPPGASVHLSTRGAVSCAAGRGPAPGMRSNSTMP